MADPFINSAEYTELNARIDSLQNLISQLSVTVAALNVALTAKTDKNTTSQASIIAQQNLQTMNQKIDAAGIVGATIVGINKITLGATPPVNNTVGDLWIDIS